MLLLKHVQDYFGRSKAVILRVFPRVSDLNEFAYALSQQFCVMQPAQFSPLILGAFFDICNFRHQKKSQKNSF
jgi:hypothetical protein